MAAIKEIQTAPRVRVRVFTLKEAEDVMHAMMSAGYEGVQNDSYRYCKESARFALKSGRCYICNDGCSIRVSDTHDKKKKKFLDVSKSKFFELLKL